VPQFKTLADHRTLEAYARFLFDKLPQYASNTESQTNLRSIVTDLLTGALEKFDFYQGSDDYSNARQRHAPKATLNPAFSFIKICLDSNHFPLAASALDKFMDMNNQTEDAARTRAVEVLLPLLPLLSDDLQSRNPTPLLPLDKLGRLSTRLVLDSIGAKGGKFSEQDAESMLQAVDLIGDADLLHSLYDQWFLI
jgi:hypothetical protein